MATELLTQAECAERLEISKRTLRRLKKAGVVPLVEGEGRHPKYPWPECRLAVELHRQRREIEAATGPDSGGGHRNLQERKMAAETRLAELKTAREEGSVIPLEVHVEVLEEVADLVRSLLLSIPGSWSGYLVGAKNKAEASKRLRPLVDEAVEDGQAKIVARLRELGNGSGP